jgi:hypothetical protein
MIQYSKILHYKYPGKEWSINNEDYDTLDWLSDGAKPTKAELDALWPAVQILIAAEIDASNETSTI